MQQRQHQDFIQQIVINMANNTQTFELATPHADAR